MIAPLMAHIGKFCQLPPERSGIIAPFFEHRVYKKKASLLDEGQRCYEKFFILKGCVHICYLKQNGVEQTIDFALENWWISDFMAFPNGAPAQFSIRAVENTEVLCISADSQRALLNEVPELHAYFHLVFQKAYAASQVRMKLLYELPKEELYRHFHQHFPGFIQRVPQYLLASFLGFTPEYLSEIRRKYLS